MVFVNNDWKPCDTLEDVLSICEDCIGYEFAKQVEVVLENEIEDAVVEAGGGK